MSTNSSQGGSFNGSRLQIERILQYLQNELEKKEQNKTGEKYKYYGTLVEG